MVFLSGENLIAEAIANHVNFFIVSGSKYTSNIKLYHM